MYMMVQDSSCKALRLSCPLNPCSRNLIEAVCCDGGYELYIQDEAECLKVGKCVLLHEHCSYQGDVCDLAGNTA